MYVSLQVSNKLSKMFGNDEVTSRTLQKGMNTQSSGDYRELRDDTEKCFKIQECNL